MSETLDPDGPMAVAWRRRHEALWERYCCKQMEGDEYIAASLALGAQPQDWKQGAPPGPKAVPQRDDRDYPTGQSNDARLQRKLVDDKTNPAIRAEGTEEVTMAGGELYDLLFCFVEWAYWNGVNDVKSSWSP